MADEEIVTQGTRRIVGRETLRRASQMVQRWQQEERDKETLARDIILGLLILSAVVFIMIRLTY
jgi:hypothetical protein